jgi:hypothetical protein
MPSGSPLRPWASVRVETTLSPSGRLTPTIVVAFSPELWPRRVRAALLELAARVELASPGPETWTVHVDAADYRHARVYLGLTRGDEAEAARGEAALHRALVAPR